MIQSRANLVRASTPPLLQATVAWENSALQEASVIYDEGTWKLWYNGGWATPGIGYATCSGDPTVPGNWTKYASNPVCGQGGSGISGAAERTNMVKVGSTYNLFYSDGTNLKLATSSDGISFNTPIQMLAGNAVGWANQWHNSTVWQAGTSDWRMLVEGHNVAPPPAWQISYATATAISGPWTVQGSGPLTSLANPLWPFGYSHPNYLGFFNGLHHIIYHVDAGNYSAIYLATSTDLTTWTQSANPVMQANFGTYEAQQCADPWVVEQSGKTFLFYDGVNNTTSTSYINAATYPGTISEMFQNLMV